MSKKKSLNAEEKREKMMEFFYETADIYQLKDLERILPKEKGIVQQSVKAVLQELVDNGKICTDKIAGSHYFWAFPGQALHATKQLLTDVEAEQQQLLHKIESIEKKLSASTTSSQEADGILTVEKEIEVLKKEKAEIEEKVNATAQEIDMESVVQKQSDTKKILEAANRWTDNIFSIKSWCKRKFDKQDRELNKAFGIPDDMDYIDIK